MRFVGPANKRFNSPEAREDLLFLRKRVGQLFEIMKTTGQKSGVLRGTRVDGTEWAVRVIGAAAGNPIVVLSVQKGTEILADVFTSSWFVFLPLDMTATDGWGEPFNGSFWGTASGARAESLLQSNGKKEYRHLRANTNYGGFYDHALRMGENYGLYSWIGADKTVLTIDSDNGNRYWGFHENRGSHIYHKGVINTLSQDARSVLGVGIATFSGVRYLYAVKLNPATDASASTEVHPPYLYEEYELWRKPWVASDALQVVSKIGHIPVGFLVPGGVDGEAIAGDLRSESTFGVSVITGTTTGEWEFVGDIPRPDYNEFYRPCDEFNNLSCVPGAAYDGTWAPLVDQSGVIGGAAFSPDGTKFVIQHKITCLTSFGLVWIAGYQEIVISESGFTATMYPNPLTQTADWAYCVAVDYDRHGRLVKMGYGVEALSDRLQSIRSISLMREGETPITIVVWKQTFGVIEPTYEAFLASITNVDLRFGNLSGDYYYGIAPESNTYYQNYAFGHFTIENFVLSYTPDFVSGGALSWPASTNIAIAHAGQDNINNYSAPVWPFTGILSDGAYNFGASNVYGEYLVNYFTYWYDYYQVYPRPFVLIDPADTPSGAAHRSYLTGVGDAMNYLNIPTGHTPTIAHMSII